MKKITWLLGAALGVGLFASNVNAQAIRDRNIIPVAVNLNEVLRMTISNGGNIEFVFNTIDDYRFGISGDVATNDNPTHADATGAANPASTGGGAADANNMYKTDFFVAASVRWLIQWGAEEATFIGTDNPANTLALDNVGFALVNNGVHQFEASGNAKATSAVNGDGGGTGFELFSNCTDNANSVTALVAYPSADPLIEDNDDDDDANAGDGADNTFTILWRCGTTEAGNGNLGVVPMNANTLLNQGNIVPDRYITNVVFELQRDF
jgi:hypothetical protein